MNWSLPSLWVGKGYLCSPSQVVQLSTRERRDLHKETESPFVNMLTVKWCAWYQWLHDSMSEHYQSINHNWQFQNDNKNPERKQIMSRKLLVSATQLERPCRPKKQILRLFAVLMAPIPLNQLPSSWIIVLVLLRLFYPQQTGQEIDIWPKHSRL